MPKRSDNHMTERRRQIVDAALRCAGEQGWMRTTVDDVAKAAGLSKGAVYTHFANKQALLIALLERSIDDNQERTAIATPESLRNHLFETLSFFLNPEGWRFAAGYMEVYVDAMRDPDTRKIVKQHADRVLIVFGLIVRRLRPDLDFVEVRARALMLVTAYEGLRSLLSVSASVSKPEIAAMVDRLLEQLKA